MAGLTPQRIAKIEARKLAEWMGAKRDPLRPEDETQIVWPDGRVQLCGQHGIDPRQQFDPINNPDDAWRVLEHVWRTFNTFEADYGLDTFWMRLDNGGGSTGDTPAEALCAAVLEMISDE